MPVTRKQSRSSSVSNISSPNPTQAPAQASATSPVAVNPSDFCGCGESENGRLMISCTECGQWWHDNCAGLSKSDLDKHKSNPNADFKCPICVVKSIKQPTVCNLLITTLRDNTISQYQVANHSHSTSTIAPNLPTSNSVESSHPGEEENVLIIDRIANPRDYIESDSIKREINRCKPSLTVKHAYSLAGGGIAIHLPNTEAKAQAKSPWPSDAFGKSNISVHEPTKNLPLCDLVIKDVHCNIPESEIQHDIEKKYQTKVEVKRFWSNRSNNPLPLVKVKVNADLYQHALVNGLEFKGKSHVCKPKQNYKVIRCYNCQHFGHISKTCKHISLCKVCSEHHDNHTQVCCAQPKCVNCGGHHPSYSVQCPTFKLVVQRLRSRTLTNTTPNGV